MSTYYKAGTWNAVCDVCGVRYKADELLKRWDGAIVCKHDYETRHPQTLLRVKHEKSTVDFIRKETDSFIVHYSCSLLARTALPGYAGPGCSIPSRVGPKGQ